MPSLRVVYVDEESALEPVRRYLEERTDTAEFDVRTETAPETVLSALDRIDCLVCGAPLPGEGRDGDAPSLAFLERVRERDASVPVVLFAGEDATVSVSEAFDAGATDYVRKPDARGRDEETADDRGHAGPAPADRGPRGSATTSRAGSPANASAVGPLPSGDGQYELLARRLESICSRHRRRDGPQPGLEEAIDHAADAVFITDADGTIEYANAAFEEVTGYPVTEAIGKNPRILKSGELDQAYYERLWDALLDGEIWEEEVVNARRSGDHYHAHQTIAPIVDDEGDVERFVAVQRDVTDRRRLEDEIERSAKTLSRLHNVAFELDRPIESTLERLLEIATESLELPIGYVTRIDGDTQRIIAAAGDHDLIEEGATDPLERTYCRRTIEADEPVVVADAEVDPDWVDDPAFDRFGLRCYIGGKVVVDGEVIGTVCFADEEPRDPHVGRVQQSTVKALAQWIGHEFERRRYERDLERYEEIIENVPVGVFRTAHDGTFLEVNEAMVEMFDAPSKAALLERPMEDCYRDRSQHDELGESLADQGGVRNTIVELETFDGEAFYGSVSAIERREREADGDLPDRGREAQLTGGTSETGGDSDDIDSSRYVDGIVQDVTERVRAKTELARSRERLQILFDHSPDGIIVHDADGRILEANATQLEQSGYDREELLSMTVADIEESLSLSELQAIWADLEPGSVLKVEGEHRRADGSTYPVEVWVSCIELEEERRYIGLSREITERKERERELERREAFVQNVSDVIMVLNRDGTVEYASPAAETVIGCSSGMLADQPLACHVHPDDEGRLESALERVVDGDEVETVEYRFRCGGCTDDASDDSVVDEASGGEETWRWVESNVRNTLEDPSIEGLLVTSRDITDRKERERELELARTQLRQVIDLVPDLIFAKNRDGEYLLANETVAELYGRPIEEIVGKTDAELLPSDAQAASFSADDRAVIESMEAKHVPEEELTAADGSTRVLETTKIPFEVAGTGEMAVLGYSRDITELKSQRDRLDLLNQVVRHDVRNDLQVVHGRAQLLADRLEEEGIPEAMDDVSEVIEAAEEAIELTNTARDLTETMLERTDGPKRIPLEPLLSAEVESVSSRYGDARVELERPVPDATVIADEMLESVVENLLVNAIVHNDSSEPQVAVSADVDDDSEWVELRIADDGPGIPDERKDAVFGKEEKGLGSPGTGLGLYLVKTLVDQYGGEVWIEDRAGGGPSGSRLEADETDVRGSVVVVRLRIADDGRGEAP